MMGLPVPSRCVRDLALRRSHSHVTGRFAVNPYGQRGFDALADCIIAWSNCDDPVFAVERVFLLPGDHFTWNLVFGKNADQ